MIPAVGVTEYVLTIGAPAAVQIVSVLELLIGPAIGFDSLPTCTVSDCD